MSGKVIHLPDEVHEKMVEYCNNNNISASSWVEALINNAILPPKLVNHPSVQNAIDEIVEQEDKHILEILKKVVVEPVAKKVINKTQEFEIQDAPGGSTDLWARPPFWSK
jgi:hypothetical protein